MASGVNVPMLDVSVEIQQASTYLTDVEREQIPFAASLALNNATEAARDRVRTQLPQHFTIAPSRLRFLSSMITFPKDAWATKQKLWTAMGINLGEAGLANPRHTAAEDRSFILGRHEEGGLRLAPDPMHPFFIPTDEIRGGAFDLVPRRLYPSSLRLAERRTPNGVLPIKSHVTRRGVVQIKGKRRTFVIDARETADPRAWGIYQRVGPTRGDVRLIWAYRQRITLPPRLHLRDTVQAMIEQHFPEFWQAALARALATAR